MAEELIYEIKIDRGATEQEIDKFTASIEKLKRENEDLLKVNKDLRKEGKENTQQYLDNAKQVEINRQAIAKNNTARKNAIRAITSENDTRGALKARLAENKKAIDQVSTSTEAGRKEIERLTKAIKQDNDALLEGEKAYGQYGRQVGNYSEATKEASRSQGVFKQGLSEVTGSLVKFANPLTAAVTGLGALFAAYKNSTLGAKDFKNAQDQLSTSVGLFSNRLAKSLGADNEEGGLLSKLIFNFNRKAFSEADAAVSALAAKNIRLLQEQEVEQLGLNRAAKEQLQEAEKLRQFRDEERNSLEERTKANERLLAVINAREAQQVKFQEKRLKSAKFLLQLDKEDLDAQRLVKEIEFEIADIREENEGFRSEALINNLALAREQREIDALNQKKTLKELKTFRESIFEEEQLNLQQITQNSEVTLTETVKREEKKRQQARKDSAKLRMQLNKAELEAEVTSLQILTQAFSGFVGQQTGVGKALALFNVGLASGEAIAKGVAAAQSVPFPGNLVAIATTISTVLANITNARSIINSAPVPTFADGGAIQIGGNRHSQGGTHFYGSDGTRFEAEQGENLYILNRAASRKINALSALNESFGGASFATSKNYLATGGQVQTANRIARDREAISSQIVTAIQNTNVMVTVEDINAGLTRSSDTITQAQVLG